MVRYNGTRRESKGAVLAKNTKADVNALGRYVYRVLHPRAVPLKCRVTKDAVIALMVNLGIPVDEMVAGEDDTLSETEDS